MEVQKETNLKRTQSKSKSCRVLEFFFLINGVPQLFNRTWSRSEDDDRDFIWASNNRRTQRAREDNADPLKMMNNFSIFLGQLWKIFG